MTALLTLERADLGDTFRAADYQPAPAESQIGLMPGERMSVRDLLRGLLVASGNDAAMTLAKGVAGSERAFVRLMNRRARELGLEHTHYGNPIGLDEPGAHSSARDLVKLAAVPAHQAVLPPHGQAGRGHAHDRRRPAHAARTATR